MYLLYCDETNLAYRSGDFFVYGGISIPGGQALSLSLSIDAIRKEWVVPPDVRLKFNPGPAHLTHGQFIELKQRIIETSIHHGVKLFTSMILHDIATSPDDARRNEINRICYHFDCYLNRVQSHGMVLIDRFDDGEVDAHLIEKFSVGIVGFPHTPQMRLRNIVGFHYSSIGQSHFPSIVDIVLGSLRHSINGHTRQDERAIGTASRVLPLLSPLFFREEGHASVSELGLFFSPKEVRKADYKEAYDGLRDFLSRNGIV